MKNWQNNESWPILSTEDENDLYRRSVVKEYHEKKPRAVADSEAYVDWKRDTHAKAAAHHSRGMKAALGAGDVEQAKKHGAMYNFHMKTLGFDPYALPPEAVRRHTMAPTNVYKFKGHPGDSLVSPPAEQMAKSERSIQEVALAIAKVIKNAVEK